MSETVSDHYLLDLGFLLKEAALDARQRANSTPDPGEKAFEQGRAMAYYEVVSLMKDQAVAFGVDAAASRLRT
jgi:hypothetical protein